MYFILFTASYVFYLTVTSEMYFSNWFRIWFLITMTSWWAWWHLKSPASPWRRHQMETLSALLAICAGNSPVPDEFPAQRPVTRSFDVFFDLRPNKLLRKKSWGWWFETPSHPLYRHRNVDCLLYHLSRRKSKRTSKLLVTGFGHRWIPRTKGQ